MILWNFPFSLGLFARCACVIYKPCIRSEFGGLTFEERTLWRSGRNSRRNHFSYGPYRANTKPLVCHQAGRRRKKGRASQVGPPPPSRRVPVGGSHAPQNERRRNERPGPLSDLSRQLHLRRSRGRRAAPAWRKQPPRRRL